MGKTKLYNLFRGGYSNEVPTITENGTDIDVSKFLKINVNVPQEQGSSDSFTKLTFDEFAALIASGEYENDKLYKIVVVNGI